MKAQITILEYIFRYNLESECEALIDFRNTWYRDTSISARSRDLTFVCTALIEQRIENQKTVTQNSD